MAGSKSGVISSDEFGTSVAADESIEVFSGLDTSQKSWYPPKFAPNSLCKLTSLSFFPGQDVYIIANDSTVPRFDAIYSFKVNGPDWIHPIKEYPEHTRFIHRTVHPIGLYAYAVSFKGAQKLL